MATESCITGDPRVRQVELWSLREDVDLELDADQALMRTPWGVVRLKNLGTMAREALRRMTFGPVSLNNAVASRLKDAEGPGGSAGEIRGELAQLHTLLNQLQYLVVRSLAVESTDPPLISVVPMTRQAVFTLPDDISMPARLSRFASMRTEDGSLILESAMSLHRVVLHSPEAAYLVSSLARPCTAQDLARAQGLPEEAVLQIVRYLVAAGMVVLAQSGDPPGTGDGGAGPSFAEDRDPALITWSGRDLLFHTRSRRGRHDEPYGATYPFLGMVSPEPLLKTVPEGPRVELYRPPLEQLLVDDMSLTAALEQRRSVRCYADAPVTTDQLGELLYRSARVRAVFSTSEKDSGRPIATSRPYPSGGAAYSLEIYVTLGRGDGTTDRGIYYYDPHGHALVLVSRNENDVRELLYAAQTGAGLLAPPPVLLTMTSRFSRMSWKYRGMWYAAILKEVGVLQQTLYLVSTAMGLAPCALGGGDSDAAARAFGLDWRTESSVGEFILGPCSQEEGDARAGAAPTHLGMRDLVAQPVNDADWAVRCRGGSTPGS
ncbi:SagB/ThcOx family dehydrogenase [Wenjunlia vitaminophila]|uniref:SagB/ThcOx family dehydrogenase n=1 Tax=Wenjunlia vitaminophila TaxID=76728 RepID=UPI0003729952|nr:SagB family peptide dehydrogenase [Wenjunlia vitaminophila]